MVWHFYLSLISKDSFLTKLFKSKKDSYFINFFILFVKNFSFFPKIYALIFLQFFLDNNNLSPFLA